MRDFEWKYGETLRVACPDCGCCVALDANTHEFANARCVACDSQMEIVKR